MDSNARLLSVLWFLFGRLEHQACVGLRLIIEMTDGVIPQYDRLDR